MASVQRNSRFVPEGWCPSHVTFCFFLVAPFLSWKWENEEIKYTSKKLPQERGESVTQVEEGVCTTQNELVASLFIWVGCDAWSTPCGFWFQRLETRAFYAVLGSILFNASTAWLGIVFYLAISLARCEHTVVFAAYLLNWTCAIV